MKSIRVLSRIAVLSLAAAGFVGLTAIFGDSVQTPRPNPSWRAERQHRPLAPNIRYISEFFGEGMVLAIYALAGRTVFRLRLSPVSRGKARPILLDLARKSHEHRASMDPEAIDPA